nr:MAG TPA: hypothetical protein [Caudoviricetes sp.]
MMNAEDYRNSINDMTQKIEDCRILKKIFKVVQAFYVEWLKLSSDDN